MSAASDITGLEVEFSLSLAAVPAWAPIGRDADGYRAHLCGDGRLAPLPETVMHHQDRWGHVKHYDDFVDLLRLEGFDADLLVGLALEAGADRVVSTARSADGWGWWDSGDDRSVARRGPRRDILRELTDAARARRLAAGLRYHGAGAADPAEHIADLLARYDVDAISGTWDPERDTVVEQALRAAPGGIRIDLDRAPSTPSDWWMRRDGRWTSGSAASSRRSISATADPNWLVAVPTGSGFGINQADPASRRLRAEQLIIHYVDALQCDGSLRVVAPLSADGVADSDDMRMLRTAGSWIRCFGPLVRAATGWHHRADGMGLFDAGEHLLAVLPADRRLVPGLTTDMARVVRVVELEPPRSGAPSSLPTPSSTDLGFDQDDEGLRLMSSPATSAGRPSVAVPALPRVLRLDVARVEPPVQLFADEAPVDVPLAPLLDGSGPGDIVQLGDGCYVGPATVPSGVTLRGLGADRTHVDSLLTLDRGARLEHLAAGNVEVPAGSSDAMLLGCTASALAVRGARATVRASRAGTIAVDGADHTIISRCRFTGDRTARSVAISVSGGRDVEIDGCSITGFETAIDVVESDGVAVRGCTVRDADTAVRLHAGERSHVCASRIERVTRAVDVAGGLATLIDGNVVIESDSGVVVRDGAAGCIVSGNYWERCRIGALLWDLDDVRVTENVTDDLAEPEHEVQRGP